MKTENIVEKYSSILPFVSVIIPTYHDWKRLQLCLNALDKQVYPKSHFEVLVVNNDPSDTPPSSLVLPKNCKLLSEVKPGSYAARNKAISLATGDIYAFTDSDCQPDSEWILTAITYLIENPDYDRIGGKISIFSKSLKANCAEQYDQEFELRQDLVVPATNSAMTANMIAKKEVFDSIGLFNDVLLSLGDIEWGKRAEEAGFKIKYLEDCIVKHPARPSIKELVSKTKRMAGGFVNVNINNKSVIYKTAIRGFLPPLFALNDAKNKNFSKKSIAIYYYLKVVKSIEIIRILRGGQPLR